MSRVAVVTGGASGMGLAVCRHLAARGDRVAVLDLQGEAAEQAAEKLRADGARALCAAVDVSSRGAVDEAFELVRKELGPVEILVTSAGIAAFERFTDITIERWERMLAVNLSGTFHCVQAAVPDMLARRWGRIVTISSSSAQTGASRMAHYVASKGGVLGLTKALALELAPHGITVNTIPPALVDTPMTQQAVAAGGIADVQVAAVAGSEQVHQARLAHGARRVLGPSAAAHRVDRHADHRPPLHRASLSRCGQGTERRDTWDSPWSTSR
jgi:2-hydroxycyclohexanecarboxyl-CoA dehydrogenase